MKGLIIGCGTIGERHLQNLKKNGITNIAICDTDKKRANQIARRYTVKKFYDLHSALSFEPEFSFICTHPTSHLEIANICVNANIHIFIEKPLSTNLKGVEQMLKKAQSKRLQIAVGYNMRYDHGLRFLKERLQSVMPNPLFISSEWGFDIKKWKPGSDYRKHYVLKKGGGIILDDSYEYDYIHLLLDDCVESVYCQTRKVSKIKTQTESIAAIVLKFRKGTIANLVIDYVRPQYERRCHIVDENGDLKWEYITGGSTWKPNGGKVKSIVMTNISGDKRAKRSFRVRPNQMYEDEIKNFIRSITKNERPVVDGWEGLKTLRIGIAALQSAEKDKIISL